MDVSTCVRTAESILPRRTPEFEQKLSWIAVSIPRVESLTYLLETDDSVSFDADPVEHEVDAFSLRLENGELTVDLQGHFDSVDEARSRVEPFLEAWEVSYGIQFRRREISFSFEDAEVVREDTETDEIDVELETLEVGVTENVAFQVERSEYPDPPDTFRLSPDARTLWNRYENYEEGREPLFSMGFACRNFLIKVMANGRQEAATKYNISDRLLQKLGTLTSTLGSPEVARKPSARRREATSEERKWIEQAIRKIILQVGISDAVHELEKLTKEDLPPLP